MSGRPKRPDRQRSDERDEGPDWATEADASIAPTWPKVDRRVHPDRRGQPTGFFSKPWRGQRRAGRRTGERDTIYVDRYSRGDVMILLCIFILNIGDALFTLLWLQRGGGEGNPIMQAMLDIGVGAFLFQKCIVVGIWLLILTAHRNYRSARFGLWGTLSVYTLLIGYHLVLVGFDVDPVIYEEADEPAVIESGLGRAPTPIAPAMAPDATYLDGPWPLDAPDASQPRDPGDAAGSEEAAEQDRQRGLDTERPLAQSHGA